MKANESTIEKFLSQTKTRFLIPVYQRNYDWKKEHCAQLVNDILKAGADKAGTHFIGSIVYILDDIYTSGSTSDLIIIDGQQRLITLTLIYIALYRLAEEMTDRKKADEIREVYLINKHSDGALKLKLTENNHKALQFLWKNNYSVTEYPEFSNIIENFNYIKSKIHQENYQYIVTGLSKLLFVDISLERGKDDPQVIFESLNSTGLDLSQADLIRNYILMRLNHEEQERIYSNYWVCIEQDCVLSKSNESKVSDFIRDYLTIENKKIPKKGNVYAEFKAKYHSLHALDLDTVLTPIKRFANHYHKLINPESEPDREIRKELTSINRLEITVAYPFLLHIYDDYANRDIEKALFIEILKCIESFLFRRFITGLEARELNKIFMNLYEKVDRADYLYSIQRALVRRGGEQRFPTDEEVSNALRSKDMYTIKERKRYILDKLENHRNKEKVIIQDNADITIEHIFPQNPDKEWEKTLDKEEYKFMKEKLHTIGNLTLSGNNGALGNKSFQEKRDLKDKGYKDSRLWLNRYLASIDAWNRETLEKRFDMIKDRFLEIWAYPSIRPDDVPAERETSLFAIDPTHRKFEYIIFRGEKKEICTMTELYREVVKQLFESRQDTFFTTDLMETVSLTRKEDKAKLNSSLEISDTWFIEGGMSSKDKQSKIKKIASAFGLEDDEILVSLSPAVP